MLRDHTLFFQRLHVAADIAVTVLAFLFAYAMRGYVLFPFFGPTWPLKDSVWLLLLILPIWWLLLASGDRHYRYRAKEFQEMAKSVFFAVLKGMVLLLVVLFAIKRLDQSRLLIGLFFIFDAAFLIAERGIIHLIMIHYRRQGRNYRNVIVVGSGFVACRFLKMIEAHGEWGLWVVEVMDWDPERIGMKLDDHRVTRPLSELSDVLKTSHVDQVVFAIGKKYLNEIAESLFVCEEVGVESSLLLDFFPEMTVARMQVDSLEGIPLLTYSTVPEANWQSAVKYVMDKLGAFLLLVLFSPIMLVTAVLVKLTSKGPVFFKQTRCGLNGRLFEVYKFRSMCVGAEELQEALWDRNEMTGPVFKIRNDPRLTPVGRVIRKLSMDELPQLFNVLKGDMSLVGPRPPIPSEVAQYEPWQRRRLSMKPGITCLWQTSGRNMIDFDQWMRLDLEYIDHWSLWLDVKLLLKTVPVVVMGHGAE